MKGPEQERPKPSKGIVPEKGKEFPVVDIIKGKIGEMIDKQIGKKTGIDVKKILEAAKPPIMHAAEGETAEGGTEGIMEKILNNPKAVRAGAAVTLAALERWTRFWSTFMEPPIPGFLKSKEEKEQEKRDKEGGGETFLEQARRYYEFGGRLENAVLKGEWDELLKKKATARKGGGIPDGKAA